MTKAEIRASLQPQLRAVPNQISTTSCFAGEQIGTLLKTLAPRHVAAYCAVAHELDVLAQLWSRTSILLPRAAAGGYEWAHARADDLVSGRFGILEPSPRAPKARAGALAATMFLVPGIAFDQRGARLGRGGGFYDRLLCNQNGPRVGICHDFQVVPCIPMELHDVPMTHLLTPTTCIKIESELIHV